jgi:hypothetical protein
VDDLRELSGEDLKAAKDEAYARYCDLLQEETRRCLAPWYARAAQLRATGSSASCRS